MSELEMTHWGTATLGSVLDAMEAAPAGADVKFDFCYLHPTTVHSYRGYYDHCALGWSSEAAGAGHWPSAESVASELREAVGNVYQGWKGGHYRMKRDTPLWIDNAGDCSGTAIVGVRIDDIGGIIIETRKVDF